jgi:L-ascorbate metabolism protein UlaG (beta-lactamase superfamily)
MPHFDGKRFFNPSPEGRHEVAPRDVWRMLRTRREAWPDRVPVTRSTPVSVIPGELAVTYIGHASFLIQTDAGAVLTDPVFSERASPLRFVGPRRVRAPGVPLDELPPIALVLLSHNHYDHCDARSLRTLIRRFEPRFVTPLGNARLLRSFGARDVTELDWWGRADVGGFDVTVTPAQHFSSRTPFDRNHALWSGFLVASGGHRVYFAGDSGYGPHFSEIGVRLGPIDLGLIPIGAYDPRWFMRPIHMNPEEAVQVHVEVGASRSLAMHHGVFRLTPEPIDEPARRLAAAVLDRGLAADSFVAPEPGERLTIASNGRPEALDEEAP